MIENYASNDDHVGWLSLVHVCVESAVVKRSDEDNISSIPTPVIGFLPVKILNSEFSTSPNSAYL